MKIRAHSNIISHVNKRSSKTLKKGKKIMCLRKFPALKDMRFWIKGPTD